MMMVVSHFSFEGLTFVLFAPVPGHCCLFTFCVGPSWKTGGTDFLMTNEANLL